MKTICSYILTVIGVILLCSSCTRSEPGRFDPNSNKLQISSVSLHSNPQWLTRASGDSNQSQPSIIYGNTLQSPDHTLTLTAQKEQWNPSPVGDSPVTRDLTVTRGTPLSSVSGIKELRLSIYATQTANWNTASPLTATLTAANLGNGFSVSPIYEWPSDPAKKTTIFTYSPLPSAKNGLTDLGSGQLLYTMPSTVADQPDLCTAPAKMNLINRTGTESQQTIPLQHQLVALGFSLRGYKATVTNIVLTNIHTGGKLTMNPDGTTTWSDMVIGSCHPTIQPHNTQDQYSSDFSNITTPDGYIMLPPQQLTDATLSIYYDTPTEINIDGGIDTYDNKSYTVQLKDLGIDQLQAGDKITYNIECRTAPPVTIEEDLPWHEYYSRRLIATDINPKDHIEIIRDEVMDEVDWLRIYKGNPSIGTAPGGMKTTWTIAPGDSYSGLHIISIRENGSPDADRIATLTIKSTHSVPQRIRIRQRKKPTIEWLRTHIGTNPGGVLNVGETVTLPFKSNAPWKITNIQPSVMTVTPMSGPATPDAGIKLNVTIPENPMGQGVRWLEITAQTTEQGHEVTETIKDGQYATARPPGILIENIWWSTIDRVGEEGVEWEQAQRYCVPPQRLPTVWEFDRLIALGRHKELFDDAPWENTNWWTSTEKNSTSGYQYVGNRYHTSPINKHYNNRVRCVLDN